MNSKIGIGIISFAHGHSNAYCHEMRTMDDVELIACWDDNTERGEAAAAKYGMDYSPHLEDVIKHREIHAVIVTCETNRHAEMVTAAASEGKHILCQKPMALTLTDCDRIEAAVQKSCIKFMMGYQMRRDAANIAMKALIDDGVLGKIGVLRRRHCINALFSEDFVTGLSRWHIEPEKNMGMFMDDASHATDFIHWMLGKPKSVIAEIDNILTDVAPDDTGVAVYRFPSGPMAILLNTSVTLAGENTTEIYGDAGVIIQNYGDGPSCNVQRPAAAVALKLYTRDEPSWKELGIPIPNSHGERIAAVPRPFIDCLKNGTEPDVTVEDGRVSVEMVLGAYRSAREGRRVTFPL